MPPPILHLRDIHLTFGGSPLLSGAELYVGEGARICLVGRNGSGKSTLLKIAAGTIDPDSGEVFRQPGVTTAYLPQEPDLSAYATSLDYVIDGFGEGQDPHRGRVILEGLGLTGSESTSTLSGGEVRRCALARVLGPEPDILLLDEPTNHLDLEAIEWLERELKSLRSAIVLISHDRRILNNLSRETVWLFQGVTRHLDDGFASFEDWRDRLVEQQEAERHKQERKLAREMEWLRKGVTARRKRNQGRLRALKTLRSEIKERRSLGEQSEMRATTGATSGKRVAELAGVSKSFDGRPIVKELNVRIQRGDRFGIIGPNGAGKTTLLKLLLGDLEPDAGSVTLGANLQPITLDQKREKLNPQWSLAAAITQGTGDTVSVGGQDRHIMGYLQDFLFSPEQIRTPVSRLSGGERGRLMLARSLSQPSNLLILDEPTNDLDLETLDLLQEMLSDYSGTVVLVSHDRDFLDRTVGSVLCFEGEGRWVHYAGGYSDMVGQRKSDIEESSKKPLVRQKPDPQKERQAPRQSKRKLSFKEKFALENLPRRMSELSEKTQELNVILSDPELYAKDPNAYSSAAEELQKVESDLAQMEEEWLTLEILREEIEAS